MSDKRKLIDIVNTNIERSDYYKSFYKTDKFMTFEEVPFISKKDVLKDQIENPPFGSNVCVEMKDVVRIHRTSGTTTKPLHLLVTQKDIEHIIDSGKNAFFLAGMSEDDIVINCMNYCMWMGGFMDHLSMEATGATVVPYGVGNTGNLINMINDFKGVSIHATPSYLGVIRKRLKDDFDMLPMDLNLKKGFFGGEAGLQNEVFRNRIEEEWGMKAINANYGLSEVISILGSECSERDGLHFTAIDHLYVELLNENKGKYEVCNIEEGAEGELVITHLYKEAQPLIRYRTGDVIKIISTEKCKCGSEKFRFKIVGRRDDMLVIKGINFYPESVRDILTNYPVLTGRYKIIVSKIDPIEKLNILIETTNISSALELKGDIQRVLKSKLYVWAEVDFTDELKIDGNKTKLVERV